MTQDNAFKVLIIEPFHEDGMKLIEARPDVIIQVVDGKSQDEIAAGIGDADGVTLRTSRLSGAVLERARRLKVVSRHGVGYDNVDLETLNRKNIPLAITADANAVSVAEHTITMMLMLAKLGVARDRAVREGDWGFRRSLDALELYGRRVLVVGFGRIGREVALRCAAFGMQISVYDPYAEHTTIGRAGYHPVDDLRAALPETDVLTVHTPLSEATRKLIGRAELAAMPSSALVINAARGGIVDETALLEALTSGTIKGAGLDVFEQEPPPENHPLFRLDNVVLSPHCASLTQEGIRRMAVSTARNLLAGLDGTLDPAMVVNPEVLRSKA